MTLLASGRKFYRVEYEDGQERRLRVPTLAEAHLASSEFEDGLHRPTLDIDFPVEVYPSSTPGHSHVYIDVPMTWADYVCLLEGLADANVVQPGYVRASRGRGATFLRVPGVTRDDLPLDGQS